LVPKGEEVGLVFLVAVGVAEQPLYLALIDFDPPIGRGLAVTVV